MDSRKKSSAGSFPTPRKPLSTPNRTPETMVGASISSEPRRKIQMEKSLPTCNLTLDPATCTLAEGWEFVDNGYPKPESQRLRLWVKGYVPPSQNRFLGKHFSHLAKEKARAAVHLSSALRSAADDPATGTITGPRDFKTCASLLDSYRMTDGKSFAAGASSRKRFTGQKTKAP